jgi:hypothetical protein
VRVPSRRVSSPTNAAAHSGRAAPPGFPYHQGTSQYKGVSWSERSKKWRAQLWHENKVRSCIALFLSTLWLSPLLHLLLLSLSLKFNPGDSPCSLEPLIPELLD